MKDLTCFEPKYRTLTGYMNYDLLLPLINEVSQKTKIPATEICGKSHKRGVVEARNIFIKRAKVLYPLMRPEYIAGAINQSKASGYYSDKNVDEIPSLRKKYKELFES